MNPKDKIYLAGHQGLVGSAIFRMLDDQGFRSIIVRTHKELDLTSQEEVNIFFQKEQPDYVILAAAKVGGRHLLTSSGLSVEYLKTSTAPSAPNFFLLIQPYLGGTSALEDSEL